MTTKHTIVSHDEWTARRKQLLAEEKELTRMHDRLAEKRRALPWERVEQDYVFDGPGGKTTLLDLFGDRTQLAVYHLMFAPEWDAACKSCTFWADNFDRIVVHLAARDIAFAAISRAPVEKLEAYRRRMGWSFPWVSSGRSPFNFDFHVSFTPEELASGAIAYNYKTYRKGVDDEYCSDLPGISVFARDGAEVFHTYSAHARGIEVVNGAYQWIDLVPNGRDEKETGGMGWLRRRDEYAR
jgi:predicted dithiol-disulfide oxidoreductase (DUF899 family)